MRESQIKRASRKAGSALCVGVLLAAVVSAAGAAPTEQSPTEVIHLDVPTSSDPEESAGGIIVADVNDDGAMDYVVTVRGYLTVCGNDGKTLWTKNVDIVVGGSSESEGLPGHHGPGVAAGDVDGDGKCELVFLTKDSIVRIVDGATGQEEATGEPAVPEGAQRWEVAMLADFRGTGGDRDILFQATNSDGYRTGRYLAAYSVAELLNGGDPLWTTDQFVSCAHNAARLADINGDGRDEVLGAMIYSAKGKLIVSPAEFRGHMDSVFVADVRPDMAGLEVVLLEEGSNHVQLLGVQGPIWRSDVERQEPQNAAVGRFKAGSEDFFVWCRSRYHEHQKPFVFDSHGNKVFDYAMDDVAPEDWTAKGVEVIHTIDWTGQRQQLACAKERHRNGDVCIFEPLTGKFVQRFKEAAFRLYVADVIGDWREEIIVRNRSELHIYQNPAPNPRPNEKRLWADRNYRRLKQCYNYYSP